MNTQQQPVPIREGFMNHIRERLCGAGFQQTERRFEHHVIAQAGTRRTLIVNGQRIEQQPQSVPIHMVCECVGEGQVISEDGRIEPFELVLFEVNYETNQPGGKFSQGHSIYYDDMQEFDELIKQYFGL